METDICEKHDVNIFITMNNYLWRDFKRFVSLTTKTKSARGTERRMRYSVRFFNNIYCTRLVQTGAMSSVTVSIL